MSEKQKAAVKKLVEAVRRLPQEKQEYVKGYADCMADMAKKSADAEKAE